MSRRKKREILEPNITPLIDIVFLLLIFFIVTSVFKSDELKLLVQLPKSSMGKSVKKDNKLNTVSLELKGNVVIYEGRNYEDLSLLDRDLSKIERKNIIELRGDEKTEYGFFISIFDLLKKNKFTNINLITKKKVRD